MAGKPFQFGLAALVWLVFISAVVFGILRYVRSASGEFFGILLAAIFFLGPLIWLFLRPNPYRGRKRAADTGPHEPAAPLDQRLKQFMSNVSPAESSPDTGEQTLLLPSSTDGKSPRERREIGQVLRRIQDPKSGETK